VVYHAQMAAEEGAFGFDEVVAGICDKMIRRHPHVFGEEAADGRGPAKGFWENAKREERAGAASDGGLLNQVPGALPALIRAVKLQRGAAGVGFDWATTDEVMAKVREEVGELEAEMAHGGDRERLEGEVGDLLFAAANLARHLGLDPEAALRRGNDKFVRRFAHIEARLGAAGRAPAQATLAEMEALWQEAKAAGG
jgi:MazG family protein